MAFKTNESAQGKSETGKNKQASARQRQGGMWRAVHWQLPQDAGLTDGVARKAK